MKPSPKGGWKEWSNEDLQPGINFRRLSEESRANLESLKTGVQTKAIDGAYSSRLCRSVQSLCHAHRSPPFSPIKGESSVLELPREPLNVLRHKSDLKALWSGQLQPTAVRTMSLGIVAYNRRENKHLSHSHLEHSALRGLLLEDGMDAGRRSQIQHKWTIAW